jgi:hypothetical protein
VKTLYIDSGDIHFVLKILVLYGFGDGTNMVNLVMARLQTLPSLLYWAQSMKSGTKQRGNHI